MKLSILIATIMMVSTAYGQSVVPAGTGDEAMLGAGYDKDTEQFRGRCLKGKAGTYGRAVSNIDFSQSISTSELEKELGFGAGTKFRYGMAEVSAAAKFHKKQQSSGFSINAVYSGDYKFENLILEFEDRASNTAEPNVRNRLSDVGLAVINNDQKWQDSCGTEYVEQIERGAKLFYSIRIDFSSTEEKETFEAAFSYDSSYASVQAYLNNSSRNFSKNTKVTIGALQIGGDVSKITELFNAENDEKSALGFVQCTFGDFSKCDAVMANAWNYATKEFKKQLAVKTDGSPSSFGPAYIAYRTKKYTAAGIHSHLPPIVNATIQATRRQVESYFDKQLSLQGEVRQLLQGRLVALSRRQRGVLQRVEETVNSNVEKLVQVAITCYDKPADCISAASSLSGGSNSGIKEIDPRDLVVEPETFQQFCSLAQTVVARRPLRDSVKGIIDSAKKLEPSAYDANAAGRTDECLITHMVLSRAQSLSLANSNITTLQPLQEYTHITHLDLAYNQIEDLGPLAAFINLIELNLHNNKVRDISVLTELKDLERLRLSNNVLRDISELKSLSNLARVDARNNYPTVSCESLPQVGVCLSTSIRMDASFVPLATRSSTPLFQPSIALLPSGKVLIVGFDRNAQVFEPTSNTFENVVGFGAPSYGHSAVALKDGRVLLTGGWGTPRRIGIYREGETAFQVNVTGLHVSRAGHQATLLSDGRVLISGGWEGGSIWSGSNPTVASEIFDPRTNTSRLIGHMHAPRAWHTATLLANGNVLITGGFSHNGSLATAEIFNPDTNTFSLIGHSMNEGRGAHTATLLNNGNVLLVGGFISTDKASDTGELYLPSEQRFRKISEPLTKPRGSHAAIKLRNGKVLITGGSKEIYTPSSPVATSDLFLGFGEIFDPSESSFSEIPSQMFLPRANHAMIEIKTGSVLIVGGLGQDAAYHSEIFTYTDSLVSSQLD